MLRYLTLILLLPINTIASKETIFSAKSGLAISKIQSKLKKAECFMIYAHKTAYLVTKQEVIQFTVDCNSLKHSVLGINKEVISFHENPFDHEAEIFITHATDLYQLLFKPVEENLKDRIYIMHSQEYSMIPWNALVDENGTYLLEKYEITLRKSIEHQSVPAKKQNNIRMAIIAPSFNGPLALRSREEKHFLQHLFKVPRNSLSKADIIHISSHGKIDTATWLSSGIFISNDSLLNNQVIAEMHLQARLVFLNVCDGARELEDGGAMVDAFHKAGATTMIASMWEVDDQLAVQISKLFYKELIRGKRTGEALRKSILTYQEKYALSSELHPIKWAGFQVYGNNEEIIDTNTFGLKRIVSLLLSMFTGFSLISYYFGSKIQERIQPSTFIFS